MPFSKYKHIDDLNETDINDLIGEEETKVLEFKLDAYEEDDPKTPDKKKTELCKDISALANADGGWIFCGVAEVDRVATRIVGLGPGFKADATERRLTECAERGIEPRVSGLRVKAIPLPTSNQNVVAIYVPRSLRAPHRSKKDWKFYLRRSVSVLEMDIAEIRAAFSLSESFEDRLKQFRRLRVEAISLKDHEDVPVTLQLENQIAIVVHSVPLTFADHGSLVDLSAFQERYPAKWVIETSLNGGRFNLDGYLYATRNPYYYIQFFRSGAVECVQLLGSFQSPFIKVNSKVISLITVEDFVLHWLAKILPAQKNLGIETPSVVMLSLVGIKEYGLASGKDHPFEHMDHPIVPLKVNKILFPDVVVGDNMADHKTVMKDIFDILWNAAGWERSMSYDENGSWIRNER